MTGWCEEVSVTFEDEDVVIDAWAHEAGSERVDGESILFSLSVIGNVSISGELRSKFKRAGLESDARVIMIQDWNF